MAYPDPVQDQPDDSGHGDPPPKKPPQDSTTEDSPES